jgi:hypothetical protein
MASWESKGGLMKKTIIKGFIVLVVAAFCQPVEAQGTLYLSNLGTSGLGEGAVASDQWIGWAFSTGANANGYDLNSVQLTMGGVFYGNPSGFTVMLYNEGRPLLHPPRFFPGSSLGILDGSDNPATAGIYPYTPESNIELLPDTVYFIVLADGTTMDTGAYGGAGGTAPVSSDGWSGYPIFFSSNNQGSSWTTLGTTVPISYPQFAINATAVPEPSTIPLILLGSEVLFYVRRNKKYFHIRRQTRA